MGEHTDKNSLFKLETGQRHTRRERAWASSAMKRGVVSQKLGRDIHLEIKDVGTPLERRSTVSSCLSHLYGSVLPGLCSPSAKYPVSFSTPDLSWDPSQAAHASLSQDRSWSECFWEDQDALWPGIIPWLFTYKELFCACVVSSVFLKGRDQRSLNPLLKQRLAPLCPCHDYYFKVFIRDTD